MTAYALPDLPYPYDALEPHIDARTMEIHHTKHHQSYVNKLNATIEAYEDLTTFDSVHELLNNFGKVPHALKTAVRNHGGGHSNHSIFWTIMGPSAGGEPSGDIASAIDDDFGSFEQFRYKLTDQATNLFGSGWAWLTLNKTGHLEVIQCSNQDSPYIEGSVPILGIDVWEHAYYLKHQNNRPMYIEAWWNAVDWNAVDARYRAARSS